MKNVLKKSYKRCSSRSTTYDPIRTANLNKLFAVELADTIEIDWVLLNIDEIHFSKSTKVNYSWLDKGINCTRNNITMKNSTLLIWAITSWGNWYVTNQTKKTTLKCLLNSSKSYRYGLKKNKRLIFVK